MLTIKATILQRTSWLQRLDDTLWQFMQTLHVSAQPGRFQPCEQGVTEEGKQIALGFSCFALKIAYTIGVWDELPAQEQKAWIAFIKSFQHGGTSSGGSVTHNAIIDLPVIEYLASLVPWHQRAIQRVYRPKHLTPLQRTVIAETKQAIATLAQVDAVPHLPYRGFPTTAHGLQRHLANLDWDRPWAAGGQAAAMSVFIVTEAPRFLPAAAVGLLRSACRSFFDGLVDGKTGAYFLGRCPDHGELVNGAMKVLTALDWLGVPIHCPTRLIDTCLAQLPAPEGCHLVDAVYVLYRCLQQTDHRRAEAQTYCVQVLDMIQRHHNADGGFSYHIGRSQTRYYDVPISRGLAVSDIHGTVLLTWAIAMILQILESDLLSWRVIKP